MSDIKAFLFDDDRGVSPVIGVILMVAITVILAAVIAAFVLGLGNTNSTAPTATFNYDFTEDGNGTGTSASDTVEIEVTSGETLDTSLLEFQVSGPDVGENSSITYPVDANEDPGSEIISSDWSDDSASAGDSVTLNLGNDDVDPAGDFELDIIFTAEDGDSSSRIGGTSGPDA